MGAVQVYAPVLNSDMECAGALAAKIQQGKLGNEFTIKQVYAPHWSNLTNSTKAKAAVDILIDYDWLETREEKTGGPIRTIFIVNPTVKEL